MGEGNGSGTGEVSGFESEGLEVVKGKEVISYDGEVSGERDVGEVYGSYVGLVAGDSGE